jgi:hypothetical protein
MDLAIQKAKSSLNNSGSNTVETDRYLLQRFSKIWNDTRFRYGGKWYLKKDKFHGITENNGEIIRERFMFDPIIGIKVRF